MRSNGESGVINKQKNVLQTKGRGLLESGQEQAASELGAKIFSEGARKMRRVTDARDEGHHCPLSSQTPLVPQQSQIPKLT